MVMYITLPFLLLFTLNSISGSPISVFAEDGPEYRLPSNVVPSSYDVELTFPGELSEVDFSGTVSIQFTLLNKEAVRAIKLHASSEYITEVTEVSVNGKDVKPEDVDRNPLTDIVTITIDDEIDLVIDGSNTLKITFNGKISTEDNYGIYQSSYVYEGKIHYLLATQFEPTYARRAFPCFDEPAFKATFTFSIKYKDSSLTALFNTEKVLDDNSNTDAELTVVGFKTTPVMSTYLVAFVLSDFTATPGEPIGDVPYSVWSREDLKESRDYAVEIGPKILAELNTYTGRDYGTDFDKMDQVALPDFAAGAMENWGLVTYRERYLLWDKDTTADTVKQSIATVIAHEFAHQWFGNLITCDWWSETFLNEGFATYFEFFATHKVIPEMQLDQQFVVSVLQAVLEVDAQENSQPLKSDANTPQEILNKFGTVSYYKGGSVLRMLAQIMGQDKFDEAVQEYVKTETRLEYSTVTSEDTWKVFDKFFNDPDLSLVDVLENWVTSPGYPLITATLSGNNLTISQEKFLFSESVANDTKWYVPINYALSNGEASKFQDTNTKLWLTPDEPQNTVEMSSDSEWVILNVLQTGYYRVNYDSSLWEKIVTALTKDGFDGIPTENRAQIVDDLFNIARANKIKYNQVLKNVKFLKQDISYFSWVAAFRGFQYVLLRTPSETQLKTKLQEEMLELMDAFYKSAPIDGTFNDHVTLLTQNLAGTWACQLGAEDCVDKAKSMFRAMVDYNAKLDKNTKRIVYCNGLRYSESTSDYDYLRELYSATQDSNEKVVILTALGCSKDQTKLNELLSETLKDDSEIRNQDAASAFSAVYSGSEVGIDVALNFLIDNFSQILTKYASMSAQRTLIRGIASRLSTEEQLTKLKGLFESQDEFQGDLKTVSEEALEEAQANLDWLEKHRSDLEEYYGIKDDSDGQPDGESDTPDDSDEQPDDESDTPDDSEGQPDDEPETPDDSDQQPDDESDTPDDSEGQPDDEPDTPDDSDGQPDDEPDTPEDSDDQPDDVPDTPEDSEDQPEDKPDGAAATAVNIFTISILALAILLN